MIAALDSSFDRPSPAQASEARAAGVLAWGGYLGSKSGLGLATLWSQADFQVLIDAGITPIGFCSGWDDPAWIKATAAEWGIQACVDVENGIREDGPWVAGFCQAAQCGLYGAMSVHYQTGENPGRGANFNIMAWYLDHDPLATWYDAIQPRPPGPVGWQWWGTHQEFGLNVDRSWLDDSILPFGPGHGGEDPMTLSDGLKVGLSHITYYALYGRGPTQTELFDLSGSINADGSNFGDLVQGLTANLSNPDVLRLQATTLADEVDALKAAEQPEPPSTTVPAHTHQVTLSGTSGGPQ